MPTVLNMLLNKPLGYTAKDVPSLRLMSCSAAPLPAQQWLAFEAMYGIKLLQLYGMSEAGWMCGNRIYKNRVGTVGPPALHQELAIVDAAGKPCPPGVEGEFTAGGPQTSVGYLRDDGTIEPIRPNRIKTGDLGVMDEDGFVRLTGRAKDLIIRGGVNIAPAEIDEVLLKHPGILEAAAVGVPDPIYGEEVVAYVVLRPRRRADRGGGARSLRGLASSSEDAEADRHRRRAAEERSRQGAARPLARRLDGAHEGVRMKPCAVIRGRRREAEANPECRKP